MKKKVKKSRKTTKKTKKDEYYCFARFGVWIASLYYIWTLLMIQGLEQNIFAFLFATISYFFIAAPLYHFGYVKN